MPKEFTEMLSVRINGSLLRKFKKVCIDYGINFQKGVEAALITWLAASSKDDLTPGD